MTNRLSEFEVIERFFAPLASAPGAFGLKDDAAIVAPRPGFDLVLKTDTIVAGVDFFADGPADAVAKKALRVNLSDLAAKGAVPFAYLLTLSLSSVDEKWLGAFAAGLRADQERFGCTLHGGDISSTPGPLTVTVAAFGHVPQGRMLRRNGAKAGDGVYVTGTIGDSGGGLAVLKDSNSHLNKDQRDFLVARYRVPEPPVAFGPRLIGIASAALDVSDGLLADLGHLADASRIRLVVDAPRVPLSPALRALWGEGEKAIVRAATAGDDYQIAFTAAAGKEQALVEAAAACGTQITRIGQAEQGSGVELRGADGRAIAVPKPGFTHF